MERKPTNRLDAGETVFFKRQLETIKSRTYDEKLADLKYAQYLPVSADAPSGATEITWRQFKQYGLARMIADYAHDFPRVDLGGVEYTVKIKDIGASYGYSLKDIRKAAIAGFDLTPRKALAARRAIEEKLNSLAWSGDSVFGIQGFIKYPGTTEYVVPATGTGSSKTWATKTADQILTDLNGLVNAVFITTAGKEEIDTILLPPAQMSLLKNTRVSSNSDTTIYQFFLNNNPGITFGVLRELDNAGTAGADIMIGYKNDAEHLTFEIPVAFEQLPEEAEGMEYVVPCHAECAGVIMYYPLSCAWGEGI